MQTNAGNDSLAASASFTQSTIWGSKDAGSLAFTGSSQTEIAGQVGNDSFTLAATYAVNHSGWCRADYVTSAGVTVVSTDTTVPGGAVVTRLLSPQRHIVPPELKSMVELVQTL